MPGLVRLAGNEFITNYLKRLLPSVTIIIPARPGEAEVGALAAARALDYPADRLEIIVARGRQPSAQRNAAIKAATGEIIYFLDDDSIPLQGNLRRAVPLFEREEVAMVGGPNLCPANAPALEQGFAATMGSWLAFGPSCARYRSVGITRETSEKELILCNLIARRSAVLELGGFDESLYPNEENALMDGLQRRGMKLLYDPELIVHRRPRSNLKSFCKMLLNYGRGRAEQFRLHPTIGSALNFVPPMFCIYLATLPVSLMLTNGLSALLLFAYVLGLFSQTFISFVRFGAEASVGLPLLLFLTHVLYGLGFWKGLFTTLKTPQQGTVEVKLEVFQK